MDRWWLSLALLSAACSGASPPRASAPTDAPATAGNAPWSPSAPASPAPGTIAESPEAPPCPPETELVAILRERWQVPADATVDVVACARGHFGGDGWLVNAFIDLADEEAESRLEILATSGDRTIAALEPGVSRPEDRFDAALGEGWEIQDLDGDGTDELLDVHDQNQVGVWSSSLTVYRVDGAQIREVRELPLGFDNQHQKAVTEPRIVQCSGRHGIGDGPAGARHVVVEGTIVRSGRAAAGTVATYCPLAGSHRYGLVGGAIVEVKP